MRKQQDLALEFVYDQQEGKCCGCNSEFSQLDDGLCSSCMYGFTKAFDILFNETWKTFKGTNPS